MAEFKLGRIRFIWKGAWASSTTYLKDDIIRNGGKTYVCVVGHTSSADFTTDLSNVPTRWNQVSDGTAWMSDWTVNTYYRLNDVVKYGGKLYICTATHTSAATITLGLEANIASWDVYANGFKWQTTWATSTKYRINEVVKYGGIVYVCNTGHTSAATATLGLENDQSKWDIFHKGLDYLGQWSGSSVRYKVNDLVNYGADVWICTTYHTSAASFVEANWARFVEALTFENTWSSATIYQPGDIVGYGGYSYISKTINSNATPSTSTANWGLFTTGFTLIGDWATSTSYLVGNIVRLGGYTYVAILDHTSSGSSTPPNLTYWSRLNYGIRWNNTAKSYTGLAGTNITGTGTTATFNVATVGTAYTVTVNAVGTGYAATNTIKILGTAVGGLTPFNDIIITVATISGSAIATITYTGIASTWATATGYVAGDTVSFGPNSYICILAHTSAAGNRPDADTVATYWNMVAAGASTSVLTTTGDIPYMGASGSTRLGIGSAGQVLKVSSSLVPFWTYFGIIDQVYYVAPTGTNTPAPDYGVTLDRPWLTVRYAAEQVDAGPLNPNGSYLLSRNRSYIQSEIIAWINYQVTNNIAPFVGFTYVQATCQRDVGYVIDALVYDLSHGGNARSVAVAQAYVGGTYTQLANQKTQDVAGYNQMVSVINSVIANSAPGTTYQATVTRISDSTKTLETGVTTLVTNLVKVITDAITAGVSTNIPAVVNTNYTIFVKTGIYYETLPIIVPANTAIVGDELRSSNIRPKSTSIATTDTTYSIATVTRLQSIISNLVQNLTVTPTTGNPLTPVTTRPASNSTVGTAAAALLTNYIAYINWYINSSGSAPALVGTNTPTATQAYYDAVEVLEANKEFLAQEAVAYTNYTYSTTVSATATNGNITVANSTNFAVGMPVVFSGTVGSSGIVVGTVYYVKTSAANVLTVAATSGGTALTWTATSGMSFTVTLSYVSATCARDVRVLVNAIKYDLVYTGNYKTLLAARYYRRCVQTSITEDMFYVRNATGLRNMTVQGLTGTLGTANTYGTKRPSAGAYVSLDPGWGAADNRTWITSRSPYIQNVTTFGTGCTGLKIDGTLHNGGNRSVVANDFTQILSDGIGVWCTGTSSLTELVSVFSYYGHIGYLAENGGKIRATNGNSSYGTYGTVAEGVDSSETALTATVNNRANQALITNVVTDLVNKIYRVEYSNAGTGYNTATYAFSGSGYGVVSTGNEFRDNAVFETRLLTNGANYVTSTNTAQNGNTVQITIAAVDSAISSAYAGMRIQLLSGTGVGQSGYIVNYNSGTKLALVAKESFPSMTATATTASSDLITVASTSTLTANMPVYFSAALANISANTLYYVKTISSTTQFSISTIAAGTVFDITSDTSAQTVAVHAAGWDHAISGTPAVAALDVTTSYIIEPRIVFASPTYSTNTNTIASNSWVDIAYGDIYATYTTVATVGGSGSGATITVTRTGNTYSAALGSGGTNYKIGDVVTVLGTNLGGVGHTTAFSASFGLPSSANWISVTYGNGKFVAVANGSTATAYSTDGITWLTPGIGLPSSTTWESVTYGNGKFVAIVNASTAAAYSTDGITWNAANALPSAASWQSVTYGNGKFVAVAYGATVAAYSTDGITWFASNALPSAASWGSVTYGNGKFVAVANSSTAAAYSTDGITWIAANALPSATNWQSVTYGNGKFVAVANGSSTAAAYSTDGITWFAANALPSAANWQSVTYGNGKFVAVAYSSTAAAYSTDGITWVSATSPSAANWQSVTYGNGKFVAVSYGATSASYLPDLSNNLYVTVTNVASGVINNFTYAGQGAGGNFVAVQASTGTYISTTGASWSAGGALPTGSWTSVAYGVVSSVSTWVVVQNGSNNTAYSTNGGTTWTTGGTLSVSGTWSSIAFGNGKFITLLGSASSTTANISSNGGTSWTATGTLPSATWIAVAYGAGTWVAIGTSGTVAAYSTNDGTSWTSSTLPTNAGWTSVTYGNGRFVAVANGTAAAYSLDGITWYSVTLPVSSNWSKVRYGQGVFVTIPSSTPASALSSEDGLFWISRSLPVNALMFAIAFGNPNNIPTWPILPQGNTSGIYLTLGATAKGRVKVSTGSIGEFRIVEPGSSYSSAPTLTITDSNATSAFTYTVRTGVGALANPTFTNRGTQFATASATVSGNGYADMYQTGNYINVSGLTSQPTAGSNIVFTGNSTVYKLVAVTNYLSSGGGIAPYNATFQVSPSMTITLAPAHITDTTLRIKYSQVRLTGHDFLNIGTGNITNTNYPGTPSLAVDSTKQTVQYGGGRVFFTSTDQDGNFNVGNLFSVQQSTGVATLNADSFNIAGLNQLTLGAVTLGGTSATITSFSTDPYFTLNSDNVVPTQKAIKAYISSQIGGGGSSLNVNTLTAGVLYLSGNTISTTTGVQINVTTKLYFIGGVDGSPMALTYFLT